MATLLIRDIHTLVSMDEKRSVLHGANIFAENGQIKWISTDVVRHPAADVVVRAEHAVAIPGLINTHHHLYQNLTRALPASADCGLFDWLKILYPIWAGIDEKFVHSAALVGMAELMLSGCTTTADHHYLFPRGENHLIDAEIEAARSIGIRFHPTRGSMSLGRSCGGLPPDSVVQGEDTILADCERVIHHFHDPAPGSMLRVALAPCSPFSVSRELLCETARMAERHDVRLHTHLAETKDEEQYCLRTFKMRPLDLLEESGWMNGRTWLAHGIHFNKREVARLGRAQVGISHCPTSNMRLGSGAAPALALRDAGSPVSLGVDGSASNDGSHMLAEARQALLLQRLMHGASAMTVFDALHMATVGGARCLGRPDLGVLEAGKRADIALFDLNQTGYSGAADPVTALLLCAPSRVQTLVVEGRVVVEDGQLRTLAIEPTLRHHQRLAAKLVSGGRP
jgi:8-oxoguanine deaminase